MEKRQPLTEEEQREKLIRSFVKDGKIETLPSKASKRIVVLEYVAEECFDAGRDYTEREVNAAIAPMYADYSTLRRELVDAGLLERKADGSQYRLAEKKAQ